MNRIAKFSSKILIVLIWFFVGVFFVDSSNLLDIFSGNEFVVSHPEDDYLTGIQNDYTSDVSLNRNTSDSHQIEDSHFKILKKLIVDWDSLSTNPLKSYTVRLVTLFDDLNEGLYNPIIIKNSLFLIHCALLI